MDEVEAVARAQCLAGGFDPDEIMPNDGPRWRYYVDGAQAAILALDAARGDPVARVVEWLRDQTVGDAEIDGGIAALADAIERGEPFNG